MAQTLYFDGLHFVQTHVCQGQKVYINAERVISGRLIGYNQRRNVWLVSIDHPDISQPYVICRDFYPVKLHSDESDQPPSECHSAEA